MQYAQLAAVILSFLMEILKSFTAGQPTANPATQAANATNQLKEMNPTVQHADLTAALQPILTTFFSVFKELLDAFHNLQLAAQKKPGAGI
jgi:predicted NodU family carbamoyl transferase